MKDLLNFWGFTLLLSIAYLKENNITNLVIAGGLLICSIYYLGKILKNKSE